MSEEHQWHFDYTRLVRDTGFTFQLHRPKSSITKNIAHIDIEKIVLHQDIALVDKNINTVLDYALDNEQSSVLDQNFVKIFYISQLSVQYLLFCKKYLDNTVAHLKKEVANGKEVINKLNHKIEEVQKEATNAKTQVKELQTSLTSQIANVPSIPVFQCNQCPKAFSTEEYLLAHIQRRHENFAHGTSFQVETDKLQSEIKALKERLNNTEKFIHYDDEKVNSKLIEGATKNGTVENTLLTELQHRFEMLKMHVDNELRMLQTQKYDQDKYEKWFETFLRKLDCYNNEKSSKAVQSDINVPNNDVKDCQMCLSRNNEKEKSPRNDHTTQTDLLDVGQQICKNCRKNMSPHYSTSSIQSSIEDFVDEKEKPLVKADNTLGKLEEMLQQRVTGSIEKLENQMQSFCDKMHEFEKQNFSSHRTTPSPTHSNELKIVPKPRKKWNPRPMSDTASYIKTGSPTPLSREKVPEVIEIKPQSNELNRKDVTLRPQEIKTPVPKPKIGFDNSDDDNAKVRTEGNVKDDVSKTDSEEYKKESITPRVKQRSITSLKNVAAALSVQQSRQKEMIDLLNKQLVELGISSEWSSLPKNSYQRALGIVMHQSNLTKKVYPNYNRIRDSILKNVEEEAKKRNQPQVKPNLKRYKRYASQTKASDLKSKMYATESETESESTIKDRRSFMRSKQNVTSQPQQAYFDVIQEFSSKTKTKDDISDVSADTDTSMSKGDVKIEQAKSVLKNYPSVGSLHKKKVFFNLKSSDEDKIDTVQVHNDESTSSIASSVLDGSKVNVTEHLDRSSNLRKIST